MDPQPIQSPPQPTPTPRISPITLISLVLVALFGISTAYLAYQNRNLQIQIANIRQQASIKPSPTQQNSNMLSYTSTEGGFTFQYPADLLTYGSYRSNQSFVEINAIDSLVIKTEILETNHVNPMTWWNTQTTESSGKPVNCFSQDTSPVIKSFYDTNKTIIDFGDNQVLQLSADKQPVCLEPPNYRILIVSHRGKLIKISFDAAASSEQILSTFQFTTKPTPSPKRLTPTPTCRPRPGCLDSKPRCLMPETADMCPRATPTPTPYGKTSYTCPANGWVDCMPKIAPDRSDDCSKEAMAWYKANCENFHGGAY